MDNSVDLSIAIDLLNRKIAGLNLKILEKNMPELQNQLDKYLKIKQEIYEGNISLIKKVINDEI